MDGKEKSSQRAAENDSGALENINTGESLGILPINLNFSPLFDSPSGRME